MSTEINGEHKQIKQRVNRLIGQLKGITKMLDEKRECPHILLQIAAIKSAVSRLGLEIAKQELCSAVPEQTNKLTRILDELTRV